MSKLREIYDNADPKPVVEYSLFSTRVNVKNFPITRALYEKKNTKAQRIAKAKKSFGVRR